jgi:hypothetical protein
MASHTNTGPARSELTTVITIEDALILFQPGAQHTSSPTGQLTNLGATVTDPETVDSSATPDGRYLYTQTGANGIVDTFAVNANGSLTGIGSVTVANAVGGEGIVAL